MSIFLIMVITFDDILSLVVETLKKLNHEYLLLPFGIRSSSFFSN